MRNADRDIKSVEKMDTLPHITISIKNSSGDSCEIAVFEDLRLPFAEFLKNHFNNEKGKIYKEIADELKR